MPSKPLARFTDFMQWLLKQYREVLEYSARNYPFRIVSDHRSPRTGDTIFTIQFVGKSTCIKMNADVLANDDELIQGFSPKDVKHIVKASLIKSKLTLVPGGLTQPAYKIIAKNFARKKNKPSYLIEQITHNKVITKTVGLDEVTQSKETLLKFSKQDIFEIAYTAGASSILNSQEEIKQQRDS